MSKEMQRLLLVDYFTGVKKLPKSELSVFTSFFLSNQTILDIVCQTAPYVEFKSGKALIGLPPDEVIQKQENFKEILSYLLKDKAIVELMCLYSSYIKSPKRYVVSKPLVQALKQTKLSVSSRHLPDEFTGFIDIPNIKDEEGETLLGIFAKISKKSGEHEIRLAWITDLKKLNIGFLHSKLEEDKTLEEVCRDYKYKLKFFDPDKGEIEEKITDTKLDLYHNVIVNVIMYITSSNADIVEQMNAFSNKKSKLETQKKIFTPDPYCMVGGNFIMPNVKLPMPSNIHVRAHWRWQPHGPGMSLHKWIMIKEHLRNKRNEQIN